MKIMKKALYVLTVIILAGCAGTGGQTHREGEFTRHFEKSLFGVTENGLFSVEMVVKEHELKTGVNALDLIVHDNRDRDVIGAKIEVTPWMPEMGHGAFEKPVITERGGGLYTVENIELIMGGHWELRINVSAEGRSDSVVFDFPDVKADGGHHHMMMKSPTKADLDLSTSKATDRGLFTVSYHSISDYIPVNKIHSWLLLIEDAAGRPVEHATVAVEGDMPEHGHGMPTEPEVSEEMVEGQYIVNGMKFSMPGWWMVKFNIKTESGEDSVTFNLLLR